MTRFIDKQIRVKFAGGRECGGTLKGYDPLLNIVIDDTIEYLRDPDDPYKLTQARSLKIGAKFDCTFCQNYLLSQSMLYRVLGKEGHTESCSNFINF